MKRRGDSQINRDARRQAERVEVASRLQHEAAMKELRRTNGRSLTHDVV